MSRSIPIVWISLIVLNCSCGEAVLEPTDENVIGKWMNKSNGQITTWDLQSDGSLMVATENPSGLFPIGPVMFVEDSKHWELKGKILQFGGEFGSSFKILKLTDTRLRLEPHLSINGRQENLVFTRENKHDGNK